MINDNEIKKLLRQSKIEYANYLKLGEGDDLVQAGELLWECFRANIAQVTHTKIANFNQKVQALESELRIEKEHLNKEITTLDKTLEEQEKSVKNYFDSIRLELAKLIPSRYNNNRNNSTFETEVDKKRVDEKED